MSAPSIFVSYSHLDEKALARLRVHFAPLEREGLVRFWADTDIGFGANWHQEIAVALRSCSHVVPLLSANFFASSYICENEVPVMLEREAAGQVKIVPIFWSHAAEPEFEQRLPTGERRKRRLSEWQGLATPLRPMKSLEHTKRDALLAKWMTALRLEVGGAPKRAARVVPSAEVSRRDENRVALTIEIERQGADVHLSYRRPGQKPFKIRSFDWRPWASSVQEIHRTLDNFSHGKLEAWAAQPANSASLLTFLFGDDKTWPDLLSGLFEHPGATFLLRRVDLRIVTRERELAALPWRLLSFRDRFLIAEGWTIATGREVDPANAVQTLPHGEVLIAAAGEDGGLAERLALFLRETWNIPETDGRLQICRTAKELRAALGFMAPHLILATGKAEGGALEFKDGRVPCRELEEARDVKALVLSCTGFSGYEAQAAIPFLLWPRSDELGSGWADGQLLTFLQDWLVDGKGPVRALHELGSGAATWRVNADYRTWQVQGTSEPAAHVRDLLDRIDQKSRVLRACLQLAKPSSPRRVLALIAHAGPEDGVAHHSRQLVHSLEVDAKDLPINQFRLEIPAVRQDLRRDLEDLLQQLVPKAGNHPLTTKQALRSLAPRKTGENVPLLWIDCGCVAGSEFSKEELLRWVAFADECLLPNCPENLRLVLFLGMHFSADKLEKASESLRNFETSTRVQLGTLLEVLPRLHEVPVKELTDFLKEHACPEPLRAAQLIHAATQGNFDGTVKLIEKGQKGWLTLIAQLDKQNPKMQDISGEW